MSLRSSIIKLSLLTRAKDWRFTFVPFVMGCVYLWLVLFDVEFNGKAFKLVGLSILTTFGFAAFGYFINEFFDREVDKKAGKINKMELLKPIHRFLLFVVILGAVFLPWLGLPCNRASYVLIAMEVGLFLLYSLPYIRLKEKPFVAGFVDAAYAYVVPLILSFHTYALYSEKPRVPLFFPFFMSAVFFVGYRNIIIHQVDDLFKDMRAGVSTLPQILGPSKTNILLRVTIILELILFIIAFAVLGFSNSIFWIWIPVFFVLVIYRYRTLDGSPWKRFFSIQPVRHLTDMIHLVVFPLLVLILLTIQDWRWGIFLLLHLLFLVPGYSVNVFRQAMSNIRSVLSYVLNHAIYFLFRLFGVDLVKENKSALGYIKHKWSK